jgi:hypothetical protein
MSESSLSRRSVLKQLAIGASLLPLGMRVARAAATAPLLSPASPEAKAVRYVEIASDAKGATSGSTCANCALYQGSSGSTQGPCQLFPGKDVKAAGWCSSWAAQM